MRYAAPKNSIRPLLSPRNLKVEENFSVIHFLDNKILSTTPKAKNPDFLNESIYLKKKKFATFIAPFQCRYNAIPSKLLYLRFWSLILHLQLCVTSLMAPMPAPKHHAPNLSARPITPENQCASPIAYTRTHGVLCFADHVAIRIGPIPTALNFVASVSHAHKTRSIQNRDWLKFFMPFRQSIQRESTRSLQWCRLVHV